MRRLLVSILGLTVFSSIAAPGLAGGWAVVHLDEPPDEVLVDTPWRFGFTVLQHDETPISEVDAVVKATHVATGEELNFLATQEGAEGHFVAEVQFPRAGDWKWAIEPEPFAETTFEPLTVSALATARTSRLVAVIKGTCTAAIGQTGDEPAARLAESSLEMAEGGGVATGSLSIDGPFSELAEDDHALAVFESSEDARVIACGDLEESVFGVAPVALQPVAGSGETGVVLLAPKGERTESTVYLFALEREPNIQQFRETATIEIDGKEVNQTWFSPESLTVAPGTRVKWVNQAGSAHMVSIDDLAYHDSGWVEPGESFSLIFTEPGVFHYRCGPHPWMTGAIVVA